MVCELYFNKAVIKKKFKQEKRLRFTGRLKEREGRDQQWRGMRICTDENTRGRAALNYWDFCREG